MHGKECGIFVGQGCGEEGDIGRGAELEVLASRLAVFEECLEDGGEVLGAAFDVGGECGDGFEGDVAVLFLARALRKAEECADSECVGGGDGVVSGVFHAGEELLAAGGGEEETAAVGVGEFADERVGEFEARVCGPWCRGGWWGWWNR